MAFELDIEKLSKTLQSRHRQSEPTEGRTIAAVLLPLFYQEDRWFLLFTLRSDQVEHHKRQISFPGGKQDPGEDLMQTALREAEEEVGINPLSVRILGALDDIVTITNYRVTPFVGVVSFPWEAKMSLIEIDELLMIPFDELANPMNFGKKNVMLDGEGHDTYGYQWGKYVIWGATARILHQFLEVIL